MNMQTRHFVHEIVFVLGCVLMAGGIATETNGAVVVGICGAVTGFGTWLIWRNT